MESVIDYRKMYVNFLIRCIEDKLEEIKRINEMPEELLRQKMIEEDINMEMYKKKSGIK